MRTGRRLVTLLAASRRPPLGRPATLALIAAGADVNRAQPDGATSNPSRCAAASRWRASSSTDQLVRSPTANSRESSGHARVRARTLRFP